MKAHEKGKSDNANEVIEYIVAKINRNITNHCTVLDNILSRISSSIQYNRD